MQDQVVLQGGRVWRSGQELQAADVLVSEGRIAVIGAVESPGVRRIDVSGLVLFPGLIDFHTHTTHYRGIEHDSPARGAFRAVNRARELLRCGITTVRDTGSYRVLDLELRSAIEGGVVVGPRMFCAGGFIAMTGGHGHPRGIQADGIVEVRKAARQQLHAGADFLKIMCSGGLLVPGTAHRIQYTEDEIRAAAEEAAARGTVLAAHAQPAAAIQRAVRAGAKFIEHGAYVDTETAGLMAEEQVVLTPTFAVYWLTADQSSEQSMAAAAREIVDAKVHAFEAAVEAGVQWAVGSDSGTLTPPESLVDEIAFITRVGIPLPEVLDRVTVGNAQLLGLDDVGRLEEGWRADVIAVSADPRSDPDTLRNVQVTVANGRVLDWRDAEWD